MTSFIEKYPPDPPALNAIDGHCTALSTWTKSAGLFEKYSDRSFDGGIYRLHGSSAIAKWTASVENAFPDFQNRVLCFGREWMGNQFCLDKKRIQANEPMILLFEIGTGKVLELPATYETFHSKLAIEQADGVFAESMYRRWRKGHSERIGETQCVGYKIPLFLGGKDDLENLEMSDADVYWHLMSELLTQSRDLPQGTKISSVSAD